MLQSLEKRCSVDITPGKVLVRGGEISHCLGSIEETGFCGFISGAKRKRKTNEMTARPIMTKEGRFRRPWLFR
ncbi:hypothetical protein BC937DRAFT_88405 [Endogone sp. FLAS-F59071]|nr:hypothetical protein BC937DRAFT_88405 [Endogone sp. FLAS-F59071]|eukprot:RUS18735.1 hypothetical protein BC937DRAFT_88405 [Endogone sp. FLAS-F59071]